MQQFRRNYRLLERLFLRSGAQDQFQGPGLVDETVIPVWDSMRPRPGDVLFDSRALAGNTVGAGNFTLSSSASPPPRGFVRVITAGAVFNPDVAARNVFFQITQRVGTPAPPWGSWWTLAGGSRVVSVRNAVPTVAWNDIGNFPLWFEDTDVEAVFMGMAGAGLQCQFHFTFVEIAGELIDVELRKLS